MNFFTRLSFALLLFAAAFQCDAQTNTFYKFAPAAGVLKGSSNTYVTQSAVAADIYGLWSGTCNAGTFLRGDGACASASASPAGSDTQIQFNSSGGFGASVNLFWNNTSKILNVGSSSTPGTFTMGSLDSMVVNGVTVPTPAFAINSNVQGVIENHSYVNGTASGGARYYGVRSEGSISAPTIVANGDHLSAIYAAGYNGTNYSLGGSIIFSVDGTPGASAMPTDVDISLSPSGSQTPSSVLKLFNTGAFSVNGSQGNAGDILFSGGTGVATAWASAASKAIPRIVSTPTSGDCVNWVTSTTIGDTGSPCGAGGGGGVSSVGLSMPSEFSVAGTPVTTSGTLAVTRVAGSATIAFANAPSNVNVTTEGTVDWLIIGSGTLPDQLANFTSASAGTGTQRKATGNLQIFGFGPNNGTTVNAGGAWGSPSFTASALDSRGTLSSFTTAVPSSLAFLSGANNVGFTFRVPCVTQQRVVRVYDSNGGAYHVSVISSDGSINVDSGSHTPSTNEQVTITYTCTYPGSTLSVFVGDTGSSTSNISIGGITLGSI